MVSYYLSQETHSENDNEIRWEDRKHINKTHLKLNNYGEKIKLIQGKYKMVR